MKYVAYRTCRADELESLKAGAGLKALAPGCIKYSIADHIRNQKLKTRYMSAAKNPLAGVMYLHGAPLIIVGITKPYDCDAAAEADRLFPANEAGRRSPAYNFAKASDEVIYTDAISGDSCQLLVDGTQWESIEPSEEERAIISARFCHEIAWLDRDPAAVANKKAVSNTLTMLEACAEKALEEDRLDLFSAVAHLAVSVMYGRK